MKFCHTLSLNSNPDWADHYIDYSGLKKMINAFDARGASTEKVEIEFGGAQSGVEVLESARCRNIFLEKIEVMVDSVRSFYYEKLKELDTELIRLQSSINAGTDHVVEKSPLLDKHRLDDTISGKQKSRREDLRRELCDLFLQYHNLKVYASINCTGVRKILKKYDKTMHDNLKETQLDRMKNMLPFWDGTPHVEGNMEKLRDYFTLYFCNGDSNEALRQLNLMVREFVTFQRQSVWLDIVEENRKHAAAELDSFAIAPSKKKPISGHVQLSKMLPFGVTTAVFMALLWLPGIFDEEPEKRNALAMLVFVSLLWATEALPLFVTAMLVPFLTVVLRVMVVDGIRLNADETSKLVFEAMFSHVIMLLIGGFSIAAALSKHNIAKILASSITRRCGSGMRTVLAVNIFIATVASLWVSNVAAPVLCYSIISPILKTTTAEKSRAAFGAEKYISATQDYRLCRALVMGIALASNVGGMASPISSPQNLFALEYANKEIGWASWLYVSIPLCITLDIMIWLWLVFTFQLPATESLAVRSSLQRDRSTSNESLSIEQYFVIFVSIGVVLLWCDNGNISGVTGEMGVLGIVPFVFFFGSGILSKEDLNNFLWGVIILAMGGLVLGEAVTSSGLLNVIASEIAQFIEYHSLSLWATTCIFSSLILVCTTFVSHTVGAIVVLPIASAVGSNMDDTQGSTVLVFAGALACSAAMGLPVSGFPNVTAVNIEDTLGNPFLVTKDFIKIAVPASIFSCAVIVTMAYTLIIQATI